MTLLVLMLCSFAVATTEFVLVGLLPEIASDLSVSVPAAGGLVTAYMVVATVGGPAAVVLTRRLPRRTVLAAAMALALVSAGVSAVAQTYAVLLVARLGSAVAQALFVAVASQVAMAAVAPERQTAAVARVFNGFALATVIGLPLGTLIGQAYGWHVTFAVVAAATALGLGGVLFFVPPTPAGVAEPLGRSFGAVLRPRILFGLAVALLAFTGFVAAFTYVAPMLRDVTGLQPGGVSAALVVYGVGSVVGGAVAGRVHPRRIARILPIPLATLAGVLLLQGPGLHHPVTAVLSVFLLGASAFSCAPLLQTWLMSEAGDAAAGLAAAVNISVFGLAGALGAGLGGAAISAGLHLDQVSPAAATPVLLAVAIAVGLAGYRVAVSRNERSVP